MTSTTKTAGLAWADPASWVALASFAEEAQTCLRPEAKTERLGGPVQQRLPC